MKKLNGMSLKYLRRERGAKEVTEIRVKVNPVKHLLFFNLLIITGLFLGGCSEKVIQATSQVKTEKSFDTTLYNLSYMEGLRQKMLGNTGEAVKFFEQALKINPLSDASAFEISVISYLMGDTETALKYGRKACTIDEENVWYQNNLANIYFSNKMVDSAIVVLEKIAILDPGDEEVLFNLAGLYLDTGRAAEAEKIFQEFRNRYGANEQIVYSLISAKNAQGKYKESEEMLLEMMKIDSTNISYPGMLAEQYRKLGDDDRALEVYRELFEREPDNGILILSYTDFLLESGKHEELSESLGSIMINDSLAKEDKIGIILNVTNNESFMQNYSDRALLAALLLEANYPGDNDTGYALAAVYEKTGDNDKFVAKITELLEKDPGNYAGWEQLLLKVNEIGDTKMLYELAGKVSRQFNIYPLPKLLLAFAATDLGKYQEALDELTKVRILVNEQPVYMVQILSLEADIYYRQGKYDLAFSRFESALFINPDDPLILNNYAYFLAEQNRELEKAEKMIEKCLKIERNDTYLDTYAWVLYRLEKYKQAGNIMKEIFVKEIDDAELLEHYGYILKAGGNCREALIYLKESLKIDSTKQYLQEAIKECEEKN